ncbi:MAG TPA: chloride channel protein [Kineosporiaceae bacterium]
MDPWGLGREAAPKLLGAAAGSVLAQWRGLTVGQRRLLVSCGEDAGMAAVYNVPLGGALITAELLYGSLALPAILPALACAGSRPGSPGYPCRSALPVPMCPPTRCTSRTWCSPSWPGL